MKIATIREFRDKATSYFKEEEPILVTRHGKVTGLYLPMEHPESFPFELRKEILVRLGEYISRSLGKKGVSKEKLIEEFESYRKRQ